MDRVYGNWMYMPNFPKKWSYSSILNYFPWASISYIKSQKTTYDRFLTTKNRISRQKVKIIELDHFQAIGQVNNIPTMQFWLEFPKIMWYHWLIVSRFSKIMRWKLRKCFIMLFLILIMLDDWFIPSLFAIGNAGYQWSPSALATRL